MPISARSLLRSCSAIFVSSIVAAGILTAPSATAVASPPTFDYAQSGTSPLRVPTAGGVVLYMFGVGGVAEGATATFTSYDGATTVGNVPVVYDANSELFTVLAPMMPAGPAKITLLNPGSEATSTFMTVSYGDTIVDMPVTCTETSIPLNANVGDFVHLIPSGACGDVYVPYPTQAPSYTRGVWSVGALGNLTNPPAHFTAAVHPLATAGFFTNPPYWPTTQPGLAQSEFGSWHPVVGSDWVSADSSWVGGYNRFSDNPTGLVLQVMPATAIGDHVAFIYQLEPSTPLPEQTPMESVQIPIVYSGGRVIPPAPAPAGEPAPAPAPTVTPAVAPIVIPSTPPVAAPVELPAGTAGAMVNGVSIPVTMSAAPGGNAVVVSAGGVSVEVGGLGPNGVPLPLAPDGSVIVGDSGGVQMNGAGFSPNSMVSLFLYSTPTKLGELPVSASGAYGGSALIPAGVAAGSHTIQAVGYTPSGTTLALSVGVTVEVAPVMRGTHPEVRTTAGAKATETRFLATVRGVEPRCTVRFWTKGSTVTAVAGVAGRAKAVLKAPAAAGSWVVTATVSGIGCERHVAKSRYTVVASPPKR